MSLAKVQAVKDKGVAFLKRIGQAAAARKLDAESAASYATRKGITVENPLRKKSASRKKTRSKVRANPKRKSVASKSRAGLKRPARVKPQRKTRKAVRRAPRATSRRKKNVFGLDRIFGSSRKPRVTSVTWDRAGARRRGAALQRAGVSKKQLPAYTGYSWRELQGSFDPGFITKVMSGLKANPRKRTKVGPRNRGRNLVPPAATVRGLYKKALAKLKKLSNPQRTAVGTKIRQLMAEGYPKQQAIAIALGMQRRSKPGARRRRNQGGALTRAEETYSMFHGRGPREILEVKELVGEPDTTAALGRLVSLKIDEPGQYEFVIQFVKSEEQPLLATDCDANQLYIVGGDQSMDEILKTAGIGGNLDMVDIGEVAQVEYFTQKGFDNFAPVVYFHDFGEEDKKRNPRSKPRRPRLIYSRRNKKLHLVGGAYRIKKEGIIN